MCLIVQPVLLGTLVWLVSTCAIGNGYVELDDQLYLRDHTLAQGFTAQAFSFAFTSVREVYWHPLTWLSHALDFELFGTNLAGHHFTSLLLHAISAALLYLVLVRLGAGRWTAAVGSLLWALHPLRVESFAWLAERKDVLCAAFFLGSVAAYLRYVERPSRRLYAAWFLLGAAALMSKPTSVSLPAILLLLDFWPRRRQDPLIRLIIEKLPLVAGAAVVALLTMIGQSAAGSTSLIHVDLPARLENAAISCLRYFGKMFWPVDLNPFYRYHANWSAPLVIGSTLFVATVSAIVIQQRKRRPWLLFGWIWFLITLLPNAGIVQAGYQSMADRFTHLPMIGIVITIVWTVADWAGGHPMRERAAAWTAAAVLVVLAGLTVRQIGYWHDSRTLFLRSIALEDSAFMRENMANILMQEGRDREAEFHLLAGLRIDPQQYTLHDRLANLYRRTDRLDEALTEANAAVTLAPDERMVVETAGMVHYRRGECINAAHYFERALRLGTPPETIATMMNDAGAWLASQGRPGEAEPLIRRAVELNPLLVQARRNLVLVLEDQGRAAEARIALDAAIRATGPRTEYAGVLP